MHGFGDLAALPPSVASAVASSAAPAPGVDGRLGGGGKGGGGGDGAPEFAWEKAYEFAWESVVEDESGRLRADAYMRRQRAARSRCVGDGDVAASGADADVAVA